MTRRTKAPTTADLFGPPGSVAGARAQLDAQIAADRDVKPANVAREVVPSAAPAPVDVTIQPPTPAARTFRQYARVGDAIMAGEIAEWGPAIELIDKHGCYHQIRSDGDEFFERTWDVNHGHWSEGEEDGFDRMGYAGHGLEEYVDQGMTFPMLMRGPCIVLAEAEVIDNDEWEDQAYRYVESKDDPAARWPS